jgi:hypothetical protein
MASAWIAPSNSIPRSTSRTGREFGAKITDQMPFYNTFREGQDAVMREGKYLPLTAEVANAQLRKLEEAAK